MRRAVLVLLAVAAVLVVAAGAVVAADSTTCEADGGGCAGTREADTMTGSFASDLPLSTGNGQIAGLEGNDAIEVGTGQDAV